MRNTNRTERSCVRLVYVLGIMMALMLAGCDQEPPPDMSERSDFIGVWEQGRYGKDSTYVYLQISADGQLAYARSERNNGTYVCVAADRSTVDVFTDTQIKTSILWLFSMDFEINEPPTAVGDTLQMTIDGHELKRTDGRSDGFDYSWSCDDGLFRERAY